MLNRTKIAIIFGLIAVTTYAMEHDELDLQIQRIFKEEKCINNGQKMLNTCISLALKQKYKKLRTKIEKIHADKSIFSDFFTKLFSCDQACVDFSLIHKIRQVTSLIINQKQRASQLEELHTRSLYISRLTHAPICHHDASSFNQNQHSLAYDCTPENSSFILTPNQSQQSRYETNQPLETATTYYQFDQFPSIEPKEKEHSLAASSVLKCHIVPVLMLPTYFQTPPSTTKNNQTALYNQSLHQFLDQEEEIASGTVSLLSQQSNHENTLNLRDISHDCDAEYQPFKKFRYK